MRLSFDVGANDGTDTVWMANHGSAVHAFEPVTELCEEIRQRTAKFGQCVRVNCCAVSDVPGTVKFRLSKRRNWGCGSIHEFSDGLEETWPGRDDFGVDEVREVPCIRMDDYCFENNITCVDWLHIDTQGHDLKVMESFGEMLHIVRAGRFEVALEEKYRLYKDSPTLADAMRFLWKHDLEITNITPDGCSTLFTSSNTSTSRATNAAGVSSRPICPAMP